jgi:superfamily I DNA and RNA helicase
MPFAYALALEEITTRFDAVVIDEAQDLTAEGWMPIEMLLADDASKFFLFSDTNQRLFSTMNDIPDLSPPFLLYSNCRNTKAIHEAAYQDYEGPEILPPSIEGDPVLIITEGKISDQIQKTETIVSDLIHQQGVSPEDIIVLVADSITAQDKFNWLCDNTNRVKYAESELVINGSVRVSTVKKFKGLEAAIVILWGATEVPDYDRQEIHYVGVSRAKAICYLVN